MTEMLSYHQALEIIMAQAQTPQPEDMYLTDALGSVLAEDIISNVNVPPFANSAMDGFALMSEDTFETEDGIPKPLEIRDSIAAGTDDIPKPLTRGVAAEIMTGAPVPENADTVIPVEMTSVIEDKLILNEPYPAGRNIRHSGEDMAIGDVIAKAGQRITPAIVPSLCSLGKGIFSIIPRPKVIWFSTGRELQDDLSAPLGASQIYNSSGPYGESMIDALGGSLMWRRTVGDDGESFRTAMADALRGDADIIISTGAVSVGKYDFVRTELEKLGAEILLHRAKVRPGKPILFARLPDGRFFFGLPGNPVSSAMGLRVFVSPFLRAISGQALEPTIKAKLSNDYSTTPRLTSFLKGRLSFTEDGTLSAEVLQGQQSFKVAPMVHMNIWIIYPADTIELKAGTLVDCIPFTPMDM